MIARQNRVAWFFLAPGLVLLFGLLAFPILDAVRMSLQGGQGGLSFGHYSQMFSDPEFYTVAQNTAVFTVISVVAEMVFGVASALLLDAVPIFRGAIRTLFILPWAVPTIAAGVAWRWILNPNYGALDALLNQLGILHTYVGWLSSPTLAMAALIVVDAWKNTPFVTLLALAGLQTIPREIHEAGRIDGANWWQSITRLTIPLLRPVLLVALVFRTMWAFRVLDTVYILTKGGPADATNTLAYFTYTQAFQYIQLHYSATLAIFIGVCILILAAIYIRLLYSERAVY